MKNAKEERTAILAALTRHLIRSECKDMELLRHVDRLCRRSWSAIYPGWVAWAYYNEKLLGDRTAYEAWAVENCGA